MLDRKEFREALDKFYTKENLYILYKEYFINWIADGYIGKNLDIFQVSLIDEKSPKDIFLDLIEEFLYEKEKFNQILKILDSDVRKVFKTVILNGQCLIEEDKKEKYFNKENYYLKELNSKFNFFKFESRIDKNYLFLDYNIIRVLRFFIENKDFYIYDSKDKIKFNEYNSNNNETEFLINMKEYLNFINSGEISTTRNSKITKDSKKNMLKYCNISEYYPNTKGLDYLKTETICLLLSNMDKKYREENYFNEKNIKKIVDSFMEGKIFDTKISFPYSTAFLSYLKGIKNIWKTQEKTVKVCENLKNILKEIKEDYYVSVENIIKAFIYRDEKIELIDYKDAIDYLYINEVNYERTKIVSYENYIDYVIIPFIKSYLFILSIMGVFEIFYSKPSNCENLYLKNEYLSKYDGIKYIKLTNLGKYIFGLNENYDYLKNNEKEEIQLDDKRFLITIIGDAPVKRIFLEKIGKKIGINLYKITKDSFLRKIENYSDLIERIDKFKKIICSDDIPKNWEEFFENLAQKFNSIQEVKNYTVLKIKPDKDLLELINKDKRFKDLVLKAEKYHLLLENEKMEEVTKILKGYGYFINN